MTDEDSLISQQTEYYRARAPEYDEWFFRMGRYNRGEKHTKQWFEEVEIVRRALMGSDPHGSILELACGTGLWTRHLVSHADKLLALDISPEAIELNRRRIRDQRVVYRQVDLFSWAPAERFDYIFFGFWLSHVPPSRFDDFWDIVKKALDPVGTVFFVDSLLTQDSTAKDHAPVDANGIAKRKLNDGREFEIVKVYYDPTELEDRLRKRGWTGDIRSTGKFFLYGCISR